MQTILEARSLGDLLTEFDLDVYEWLARETMIPVISGRPQRQGDVFTVPDKLVRSAATLLPDEVSGGLAVVRGEGGHTHLLFTEVGECFADLVDPSVVDTTVTVLTVGVGSSAILGHPEHGINRIGEGSYRLLRQVDQGGRRLLAD